MIVVLLAVVASWSGTAPQCQGNTIKFMTYNVQAPGWNQNRRAQVVDTIDLELPDVLGLHEVNASGNGADLMADLQDDYEPYLTETGDPIYLRRDRSFLVVDQGIESLPTERGAVVLNWLNVETPDGARFVFYNSHFSVTFGNNDPVPNQMQAIATAEFMAAQAEPGTINLLAGDLNASQTSPTIQYLLEGEPLEIDDVIFNNPIALADSWELAPNNAGLTHPGTGASSGGNSVLDWIMTDPFADVLDAEVIAFDIPAGEEDNFSDHLPVTATINIRSGLPGDCNGDGVLDALDLECVTSAEARDIVLAVLGQDAGTEPLLPGDLNGDGRVDFTDFLRLSGSFGTAEVKYSAGNIDLINGVNFADFLMLSRNFGLVPTGRAAALPEPSSLALLSIGVLFIGLVRRRHAIICFPS